MPGSVFAFLNGFGQQGWADMSIMNIEVLAGGKRYRFQSEAGTSLKDCLLKAGILEGVRRARHLRQMRREGAFRNAGSG